MTGTLIDCREFLGPGWQDSREISIYSVVNGVISRSQDLVLHSSGFYVIGERLVSTWGLNNTHTSPRITPALLPHQHPTTTISINPLTPSPIFKVHVRRTQRCQLPYLAPGWRALAPQHHTVMEVTRSLLSSAVSPVTCVLGFKVLGAADSSNFSLASRVRSFCWMGTLSGAVTVSADNLNLDVLELIFCFLSGNDLPSVALVIVPWKELSKAIRFDITQNKTDEGIWIGEVSFCLSIVVAVRTSRGAQGGSYMLMHGLWYWQTHSDAWSAHGYWRPREGYWHMNCLELLLDLKNVSPCMRKQKAKLTVMATTADWMRNFHWNWDTSGLGL